MTSNAKAKKTSYPNRFQPVLRLLASSSDEDRQVLDDWIEEQTWDVVGDLWLATKPSKFQLGITLAVVGSRTTENQLSHALLNSSEDFDAAARSVAATHSIFVEARRQLGIHRHAKWVRVIAHDSQTSPRGDEVMLDSSYQTFKADDIGQVLRARCAVAGCLMLSYGTHLEQRTTEEPTPTEGEGK